MYIPFEALPDSARIWIYQSDRKLSSADAAILSESLRAFTEQWAVHGNPINTSFCIRFDQFVILAADDKTSGCSIDSSVRAVQEAGRAVTADFFNRNLVAFRLEQNVISLTPISGLRAALQQGQWNQDTLTFNNLVSNKGDLQSSWIVPAGASWLKRYLSSESVTQ